jgi:hypothetical protein
MGLFQRQLRRFTIDASIGRAGGLLAKALIAQSYRS